MLDWQLPILIEALAVMADIEGMKAENAARQACGDSPSHSEQSFMDCANELRCLSRDSKP